MANPTITIIGRLGQEPESVGQNGLRLRVVTNDRVRSDAGQWEDKDTSWWTVKAWRKLADQCKDTLKKGQEVIVVGKIYEENWTDSQGNKRSSYEVRADSISVTTYSLQNMEPAKEAEGTWSVKASDLPF